MIDGAGGCRFDGPHGIVRLRCGHIAVCEADHHRVTVISAGGDRITHFAFPEDSSPSLFMPWDLTEMDSEGTMAVCDCGTARIVVLQLDNDSISHVDNWPLVAPSYGIVRVV